MVCLLWLGFASLARATDWRPIEEGLEYAYTSQIHAIKMNPKKYRLRVLRAADWDRQTLTAETFAKKSGALLVVNGGFFSPERTSLGLLVDAQKILNPVHNSSWWAVFKMEGTRAEIVPHRYFRLKNNTEMALQAGPRLLINGEIPRLKFSLDRRTGLGVQPDGEIVIAVADGIELSLSAFARLFQKSEREGGFGCRDAINLDGGSSTQLYFHHAGARVHARGMTAVPNAVGVFPRED